jgi:SAM-dependent methyltransferase
VSFWQRVVADVRGPVLELGCGTGRIALPLTRASARLVGIDRSGPMLARADMRRKAGASRARRRGQVSFVRGDIRHLPFADARFGCVSPLRDPAVAVVGRDLMAALHRLARKQPRGLIGIDLVPERPWRSDDRV